MQCRHFRYSLLPLLCLTVITSATLQNGGMTFLQLPTSAQSAATMRVFAASNHSPLAIFENPVGIKTTKTMLALSHHFWFSDISIDALAISVPIGKSAVGLGINHVRIPGVEIRDNPTTEPLASVEPQYLAIATAYAFSPLPKVEIGATAKLLYEHLYTFSDRGIAVDLAGHWKAPSMIDIALTIQNIGYLESGVNANQLPSSIVIGIVRPELFEGDNLNGSIGLNLRSNLASDEATAQVGAALSYQKLLTVRGGFEQVGSVNRKSVGFGIHLDRISFDYAYLIMPEGLGNPHFLTISFQP
jgi:hypothetical protein